MLRFEIKRMAGNGTGEVCAGVSILFLIAGYLFQLPFYYPVDLGLWQSGAVVSFAQFGAMIIPALAMADICRDYTSCNVLFYKQLGLNVTRYYLVKFTSMFVFCECGLIIGLVVGCGMFADYGHFWILIFWLSCIVSAYLAISILVSLAIGNFVIAYFAQIITWIVLTFFVAQNQDNSLLWLFDQNSAFTKALNSDLISRSISSFGTIQMVEAAAYAAAIIVIAITVCAFLKKRWLSLGLR